MSNSQLRTYWTTALELGRDDQRLGPEVVGGFHVDHDGFTVVGLTVLLVAMGTFVSNFARLFASAPDPVSSAENPALGRLGSSVVVFFAGFVLAAVGEVLPAARTAVG